MELFFVALICSYQSFSGPACNTIAGAYWKEIQGEKVVDKAVKEYVNPYVEPLPVEVKGIGFAGYALYNKHAKIGLYRNISWEIKVDQINENGKTVESTNNLLTFSKSFP